MIPRKDNLIFFAKLNGAKDSSGNVLDFSGNGNSGTITGTEAYVDDRFGKKAQVFDGTSNYINLGNNDSLEGMSEFTASLWIKANNPTLASVQAILSKGSYLDEAYYIDLYEGYIRFQVGGTSPNNQKISYTSTNWNHIVIKQDASGQYLYLNGAEELGFDYNAMGSNADNVRIGARTGGNYFNGSIRDVQVWNTVLSPTEVKQVYKEAQLPPMESGLEKPIAQEQPLIRESLVGAWGFKGSRQTANDLSDSGNNGTIEGDTIVDKNGRFVLDGDGDYVDTNLNTNFSGNGDFSVSVWAKGTDMTYAVSQSHTNAPEYSSDWIINVASSSIFWFRTRTLGNLALYQDNQWHNFVMVWNRSRERYKGYADGVYLGESDLVGTCGGRDTVKIGTRGDATSSFYTGSVGEVQIFNRALTEDEIKLIYEKGVPDDSLVFETIDGVKDLAGKNTITLTNAVAGKGIEFTDGDITWSALTLGSYSYVWENSDGKIVHYANDGTNVYTNGALTGAEPITITTTGISAITGKLHNIKIFNEAKSAEWVRSDYLKSIRNW